MSTTMSNTICLSTIGDAINKAMQRYNGNGQTWKQSVKTRSIRIHRSADAETKGDRHNSRQDFACLTGQAQGFRSSCNCAHEMCRRVAVRVDSGASKSRVVRRLSMESAHDGVCHENDIKLSGSEHDRDN